MQIAHIWIVRLMGSVLMLQFSVFAISLYVMLFHVHVFVDSSM